MSAAPSRTRSEARDVVITGATRGCGRALAGELARAGHRVHGCGRTGALVDELRGVHAPPSTFERVDVADDAAVAAWAAALIRRGHVPDLVVNNAGLIHASAPLWEVPAEELTRVFDVNLGGTAAVMRAFLPAMLERGSGVVVNFSSGWGRTTAPGVAAYCATKWAVEGLSRAVAQEVTGDVAIVAVNPGIIHTTMLESCFGDATRHHARPEEWARRAAPFLLGLGAGDNGASLDVPA